MPPKTKSNREQKKKILAMKRELEAQFREKEAQRLENCVGILSKFRDNLRKHWKDTNIRFSHDLYEDSKFLNAIIPLVNQESVLSAQDIKEQTSWRSYLESANAMNEQTVAVAANAFIHTIEETLLLEPAPKTLEELQLRAPRVDRSRNFLEMHPNLFEVYFAASADCATFFSRVLKERGVSSREELEFEMPPDPDDFEESEPESEPPQSAAPEPSDAAAPAEEPSRSSSDNGRRSAFEMLKEGVSKADRVQPPAALTAPTTHDLQDIVERFYGIEDDPAPQKKTSKAPFEFFVEKDRPDLIDHDFVSLKVRLRALMYKLWDRATEYAIANPTELDGTEGELIIHRVAEHTSFSLWVNAQRNIRRRTLSYPELGLSVHLPKQLSVSAVALRITTIDSDILEECEWSPLGPLGLISILSIPPRSRQTGSWHVEETTAGMQHLPYPLKSARYPPKYPGCSWADMDLGVLPASGLATQPITVELTLPPSLVVPENPTVAVWNESAWSTDGVESFYAAEKRLISFTTSRVGPFAVVTRYGWTVPYQEWSIEPVFSEETNEITHIVVNLTLKPGSHLKFTVSPYGYEVAEGAADAKEELFESVGALVAFFRAIGLRLSPSDEDAAAANIPIRSGEIESAFATQVALAMCLPHAFARVQRVSSSPWNALLPCNAQDHPADPFPNAEHIFEYVGKESKGWIDPEKPQKKKKKKRRSKKKKKEKGGRQAPEEPEFPPGVLGPGPLGYTPQHIETLEAELESVRTYSAEMRTRLTQSDLIEEGVLFQLDLVEGTHIATTFDENFPPGLPELIVRPQSPTMEQAEEAMKGGSRRGTRGGTRMASRGGRSRAGTASSRMPRSRARSAPTAEEPVHVPVPRTELSAPEAISERFNEEAAAIAPHILLGKSNNHLSFRQCPVPAAPLEGELPCFLPAPGTRPNGTLLSLLDVNPESFENFFESLLVTNLMALLKALRFPTFG